MSNPHPWEEYQPHRRREKEFYDIELRDGTILLNCYPNGIHWNPWILKVTGGRLRRPISDYRVVKIRRSHPDPFEQR